MEICPLTEILRAESAVLVLKEPHSSSSDPVSAKRRKSDQLGSLQWKSNKNRNLISAARSRQKCMRGEGLYLEFSS
jgi:hypothetical protein